MHKRFYVTRKQVLMYILRHMYKFENLKEFKTHVHVVIQDLSDSSDTNLNQIKFYTRIELMLGDLINDIISLEDIPKL